MATKKAKKKTAKRTAKKTATKTARKGGALVVVESPAKARTISKYLDSGYTVKATVGHLRDLPQRELGVDVDKGFAPKYVTIRGKGKQLAEIKRAAKKSNQVLLATDPDREGEAIAWHVAEQLDDGSKVRRVLFHEITKDAISEAIENPTDIDDQKVEAQQARRILDRLVGYKVSPLLWRSVKTGLSAGRVQTVALRIIVEREQAIRDFKPQEYWSIDAELEAKRKRFGAKLHKIDGKKLELHSEKDARAVVKAVKGKPFVVTAVQRKQRRRRPAPPFITSTLQQEAAKRLGFASRRTMRTAQQLYEGVEMGKQGAVGLITYMRTDSPRVAPIAIDAVREYVTTRYDERYLPAKPNVYRTKKSARAQEAHEAIRPTDVALAPEKIRKYLTGDLYKLYRLIWQRFVASQMMPAVYDTTTIDFDIDKYLFRATGSVMVFDGFHVLYADTKEAGEEQTFEDLAPVPALEKGDEAAVKKITPNQHFTEPPPRFSEASLVKELEANGIGRPSTYASIVSTLRERDYVRLENRRFNPTDLGETVTRVMVARFPDIFNVEFTSQMETELDKVEEGELGWQTVLQDFYGPFSKALESVDTAAMIREAHDVGEIEKEPCPTCGGKLTVKSGRFGPFVACSNYPECRYTKPLKGDKAPDKPTDEVCKECGAPMVIKAGRYGEFLACTQYPKCKHTRPIPLGVKCPKCGGELAQRRTRRGRSFYGCSNYPECDFSTWHRPVPDRCTECGNEGAEQRSTKARGEYRLCLKCGNEFPVEEAVADVAGK
ncbi:MAG: type I DNA topoisomerase [Gemmatimonadales bacterium]|jgi:DNA topoisomerase-1